MRKVLCLGATTLCAFGMAYGVVFADPITTPGETMVDAEYTVSSSYNVEIPAVIEFAGATTAYNTAVTVNNTILEPGSQLKISMTSQNGKLINGEASYINYDVDYSGSDIAVEADTTYTLLKVAAGNTNGGTANLKFTPKGLDNVTLAGRHADTLTFAVEATSAPKYAMLNASSVYNNGDEPLVFRSEAPMGIFDHFEIDDITVLADNYTVSEGSTVITVNGDYSMLLDKGNHIAKIYSENGYAEAEFVKTFAAKTMQNIALLKGSFVDDNIEQTLVDTRDNNKYTVALIGETIWMTQNLKYAPENVSWNNDGILVQNGETYYNWDAAIAKDVSDDTKSTCPQGWVLPSKEDFDNLIEGHDQNWVMSAPFNGGLTGFTYNGTVSDFGYNGRWWASTIAYPEYEDFRYHYHFMVEPNFMLLTTIADMNGHSVRCVAE